MKELGYRKWTAVSDPVLIFELSWDEFELLRRALLAKHRTPEWIDSFVTGLNRLALRPATHEALYNQIALSHSSIYQKEDGTLWAFDEWAAAVLANHAQHGADGMWKYPAIIHLPNFAEKRYLELVNALKQQANKMRIITGR